MAELDDAYAIQSHVPDAADILAQLPYRSAEFRQSLGERVQTGISYGSSDRQVFDLFQPLSKPKGTLIFIHGGYWRIMHSSLHSFLAAGALARGWAVAMPSYDLCPDVQIHDISQQVAKSVSAIAARTTGPISISGHSAGGHLAARMLDPALVSSDIAARYHTVIPIAPLADLRPLLKTSMNDDFRLTPEQAEAESPILMQARYPSRAAVWVGSDERLALLDQARWLSHAWDIDMVLVPDRHHFDVINALLEPDSNLVRLLTS